MEQDVLELAVDTAGHDQANPLLDAVTGAVAEFVNRRLREESFWHRILPPMPVERAGDSYRVNWVAQEVIGTTVANVSAVQRLQFMAEQATQDERDATVLALEAMAADKPEASALIEQLRQCVIGARKLRL